MLPAEMRKKIYELCLCVDKEVIPYAEVYKDDYIYKGPVPAVALLAVNKNIRNEALHVLFNCNIWRITDRWVDLAGTDFADSDLSDEVNDETLWVCLLVWLQHS